MTGSGIDRTAPADEEIVAPSPRSVGLTFGAVCALVALWPIVRGAPPRAGWLAAAGIFAVIALAAPALLGPLSRWWLRLSLAMHRVVNPVVMGILFYLAVTPFGLVMRMARRGLVRRLRPDPGASTYWIARETPYSPMDQQF